MNLDLLYPEKLLKERERIRNEGTFREKVMFDCVERPNYAFGLLAAADIANSLSIRKISVIEFGVASGDGLIAMSKMAQLVTQETGVEIHITGFDLGTGLPPLESHKDHPEVWTEGDFFNKNVTQLKDKLPENCNLILGDVRDTLPPFIESLSESRPVGFVSHDMDIYSSTSSALSLYTVPSKFLLPVSIAYFDDTIGSPTRLASIYRNKWAGQLAAIDEFNKASELRKIDEIRSLQFRKPLNRAIWLKKMFAVHCFDHEYRQKENLRRASSIEEFRVDSNLHWPLS